MDLLGAYLPADRRRALARGDALPDRTRGAALFADVSGFTPLTEALLNELGPRRGAEELTRQLNLVYAALIAEVDRYGGSVITFSGDAITCWFDENAEGGKVEDKRGTAFILPTLALRATACALAMQQAMQQFASVLTPSGKVLTLAMKAAVAAGPARRFLVGDPGIQLMDALAGATLQRMAEAEHHAERGQVVVSEEAVPPGASIAHWHTDEHTGERFAVVSGLAHSVAATPWPEAADLDKDLVRPWLLKAVYERASGGQDDFLSELRPANVVFMRFLGIDYDGDPEAGAKLDQFIRWAQGILAHHNGTLLQITIGDKGSYIYAAFGAPIAHEDDTEQMVAAAIALRQAAQILPFIEAVQLGLSQGRMRVGPYGGPTRRTYGVLGDPVNLAARLMGKAEPGEVLASQPVMTIAQQRYQFESIGLVQLKGKADPLPAFRVLGGLQPAQQRSATLFTHPLVGRKTEMEALAQTLQKTMRGAGQIVRLEGPSGVGKSHLTVTFMAQAEAAGMRAVVGDCHSTRQNSPYSPWRQIFRELIAALELPADTVPLVPNWDDPPADLIQQLETAFATNAGWLLRLPVLGDLLGIDIPNNPTTAAFEPRLRQEALFALAVDLIRKWARQQPLFLLLEDIHWMDEASLGLTLALGRVVARFPALLMLVQRPPVQDPILPELNRQANQYALTLGELSLDGIAEMVSDRLGGPLTPLALSLIQARAQGNPFFTEELVDNLQEGQRVQLRATGLWDLSDALITALREAHCLVKDAEGQWLLAPNAPLAAAALELPDSVQGMVLARMDRLPETHKGTIKVASVIGRTFEFDVLTTAHPARPSDAELQAQMRTLDERDFTRMESPPPQLTYLFKHNAMQEVAYDTLLEAQQRDLHRAVGQVLEKFRPEAVEQLAYHFTRGGPEAKPKAIHYLDRAAHKAQRESANETALNYYAQALVLEERWDWRKGVVEILHILGRRDNEQAALRELERLPEAPAAETAYLWGKYYEALGDYAEAQSAIERALQAGLNPGRGLPQLGLIARRLGNYEGAKARYQQALEVLQNAGPDDQEAGLARIETLNGLGVVLRQQGNFDGARQASEDALRLSQASDNRRGEAEALNGLGAIAFYQRKFPDAIPAYERALKLRRDIGDRAGEGNSLYNLAAAVDESGDRAKALNYFRATLELQQAIGNRWEEVNAWNGLGIVNLALGDLAEAERCSRQGLRVAQEIGDEAGQAYILGNLGQVMRDAGKLEDASEVFSEGLGLVEKQADKYQMAYLLSHLALVHLKAAHFAQARERAEAALALRGELDLRLWTTADLAILAAVHQATNEPTQALDYAYRAVALLDECQGEGPEFPHQDYFICWQVLRALGHGEAAEAALAAAHRTLMARAERISDPALQQAFLERVPMNREIVAAVQG